MSGANLTWTDIISGARAKADDLSLNLPTRLGDEPRR